MDSTARSTELLNKFLNENTHEYIQSIVDEVGKMKFEGPTVEEYFTAIGFTNSSGEII